MVTTDCGPVMPLLLIVCFKISTVSVKIMLICDEPLLSDQPPLSSHFPVPRRSPPNRASIVGVFLIFRYVERGRRWSRKKNQGIYLINLLECKEMRKKQSEISQLLATEKQILLPVRAGLEIRASGLNLCELSRLERFSESYTVRTNQLLL